MTIIIQRHAAMQIARMIEVATEQATQEIGLALLHKLSQTHNKGSRFTRIDVSFCSCVASLG